MMQLADGPQWHRMHDIMDQAIDNYAVGGTDELPHSSCHTPSVEFAYGDFSAHLAGRADNHRDG